MCESITDWFHNMSTNDNNNVSTTTGQPGHNGMDGNDFTDVFDQHDQQQYYNPADSSMKQSQREQKRRPKPKDGTVLICGVCGDKALGYNFDAITCESCKAFFRRNALKTKVFTCSFDGNCKLDTHTRKFCSGCRLKKCFDIGMRKDWILNDDQLAKRKTTTKKELPTVNAKQMKQRRMEDAHGNSDEISTTYISEDSSKSPTDDFSPTKSDMEEEDYVVPLCDEYRKEIENLEVQYTQVFDCGYTEEQVQKLTGDPRSPDELFNMTDIFIRRLIKFAKHIPEFRALPQEDQIHLLKGGIMEIMVLRSAMGFDSAAMKWKLKSASSGEKKLDPTVIQKNLGTGMYVEHVKFIRSLNELTRANKTIMTLLFVIELFSSDRPNLIHKDLVSKGQEKFSTWLRAYLESQVPVGEARILYPKLLMKLLDVRSLGESSAQLASHLDITRLEPLLVEVFNLQK